MQLLLSRYRLKQATTANTAPKYSLVETLHWVQNRICRPYQLWSSCWLAGWLTLRALTGSWAVRSRPLWLLKSPSGGIIALQPIYIYRERKRSSVARVSTVVARGSKRADFWKTRRTRAPVEHILGYSTRNSELKQQEPHFIMWATRSEWKITEPAVAWPHSRECTKKPISVLPNSGSMEEFGAWAEVWNILQEQLRGRGGSSYRFDCLLLCFCGHCNTGVLQQQQWVLLLLLIIILHGCAVCVRAVLQCRRTCHLLRTSR